MRQLKAESVVDLVQAFVKRVKEERFVALASHLGQDNGLQAASLHVCDRHAAGAIAELLIQVVRGHGAEDQEGPTQHEL